MLGTFPARGMVAQWLKAGVVENGRLHRTEEGTPQGGVVSPVLLNVALHGMEQAAGVRYHTTGRDAGWASAGSPVLIRYADDFVALCHSRHEALEVKAGSPAGWRPGVWPSTRTRHASSPSMRALTSWDSTSAGTASKLLIKPSKAAVRRIRERLRTELRSLRGANAPAVIRRLNPIIRGWAAYYRGVVSSKTFSALDDYMWRLTYKWALFTHPNKPRSWIIPRYFGQFNKSRRDRWVFGDRTSGAYMQKFAWTRIVRHRMVKARRPRTTPPWPRTGPSDDARRHPCRSTRPTCGSSRPSTAAARSAGLAPARRRPATKPARVGTMAARRPHDDHPDRLREHGTSDETEPRLIHAHCHNGHHADGGRDPHFCPPASLWGLLEPCAVKAARTVLRGARRSNAPGLPGELLEPSLMPRKGPAPMGWWRGCRDWPLWSGRRRSGTSLGRDEHRRPRV